LEVIHCGATVHVCGCTGTMVNNFIYMHAAAADQ